MDTQKEWDYLIIRRNEGGTVNRIELLPMRDQLMAEVMRDPDIDIGPNDDLYRAVAIAGIGKWELVSVDNGVHYFKRPVPPPPEEDESRGSHTS